MKIFVCTIVFKFDEGKIHLSYSACGGTMENSLYGAMQKACMDESILTEIVLEKCQAHGDWNSQLHLALVSPDVASASDSISLLQMIKGMQVTEHYVCV